MTLCKLLFPNPQCSLGSRGKVEVAKRYTRASDLIASLGAGWVDDTGEKVFIAAGHLFTQNPSEVVRDNMMQLLRCISYLVHILRTYLFVIASCFQIVSNIVSALGT